jgi:hypothetical protein
VEAMRQRGFSIWRGLKGAGIAAAVGAAVALPISFGWNGPWIPVIAICACAGWTSYAPDGKHSFVWDLATFFICGIMCSDVAAVSRLSVNWRFQAFFPVLALVAVAYGITVFRVSQVRQPVPEEPGHAEPGVGADSR